MSLPNLSGTARLYADVELRYAANGNPVTKVPLVFNSRRKNQQTNEWEDSDSFFVTGTLFKERAEWAAEKLNRGDEVVVTGRLKTRSWGGQGRAEAVDGGVDGRRDRPDASDAHSEDSAAGRWLRSGRPARRRSPVRPAAAGHVWRAGAWRAAVHRAA